MRDSKFHIKNYVYDMLDKYRNDENGNNLDNYANKIINHIRSWDKSGINYIKLCVDIELSNLREIMKRLEKNVLQES